MSQTTDHVFMVKPISFGFNPETNDNYFASNSQEDSPQQKALNEFEQYTQTLKSNNINVTVIEDTLAPKTPDSIFPNNCFSIVIKENPHQRVLTWYSMFAENRRQEIPKLQTAFNQLNFKFDQTIDLTDFHTKKQFLEGTGSLVLDRVNRIAYCCISNRTNEELVKQWCQKTGFECFPFHAYDKENRVIYHTNVVMNVGTKFCVICLDAVTNEDEKNKLKEKLQGTNKVIVEITMDQMNRYAGNMLELKSTKGEKILVMSQEAKSSLTDEQVHLLETDVKIVYVPIPTIEKLGGGSARCMLAEIF